MSTESFSLSTQQQVLMDLVYEEVECAMKEGNRPFGALITDPEGEIIAKTHNQVNTKKLAIAHGEIEAIQEACAKIGKKKLNDCTIYVNAESCAMCSGAIIKAGITKVFYGAHAPLEESSPNLYLREINKKANPKLEIHGGIMEEKFKEQIMKSKENGQKALIFDTPSYDIQLWTDGACVFNGTPKAKAAWAFVSDETQQAGLVSGAKQTNNVAEGLAILYALKWAAQKGYKKIQLHTDSQISLYNLHKPARLVKVNREIFEQIEQIIKTNNLNVQYEKVLGHSGDLNNERADKLANQLAAS
jgi:tRNA(adenine34) deaminase